VENHTLKGHPWGKLLTAWASSRVLNFENATQLERLVPATGLPYLAGITAKISTKDAFLSALDFVYVDAHASGRLHI
jgi:hypothetical protein